MPSVRALWIAAALCVSSLALADEASAPEEPQPDNDPLLVKAALAGELEEVERLLQAGTDVNAADADGMTALMRAAAANRIPVVQALLKRGPDLDRVEPRRLQTALHLAVVKKRTEVVDLLLGAGARVTLTDRSKKTPLEAALDGKSFAIARRLIRAGADPTIKLEGGEPALCRAIFEGRADLVTLMLDRGVSPNESCRSANVGTPLAAAVFHGGGSTEIAAMLLARGARLDEKSSDGVPPLLLAADQGKLQLVKLLIEHGADPNITTSDGRTLLDMPDNLARAAPFRDYVLDRYGGRLVASIRAPHEFLRAVRRGEPVEITRRLDAGVNLKGPVGHRHYPLGSIALQEAARLGNVEVVRLLLRRRVPARTPGLFFNDHDAVGLAAAAGHWDVVRALVEAGAPATDETAAVSFCGGRSLLDTAAAAGRLDMMKFLWERGARLETRSEDRPDVPVCALKKGTEVTAFYLDDRGALLNRKYDAGYGIGKTTLLLAAIEHAPLPVIQLLIDKGAALSFTTTWSISDYDNPKKHRRMRVGPADVAALEGRYDVLAFLLGRKAAANPAKRAEYGLLRAAFEGDRDAVRRARATSTASQLGQAMIAAALGNRADIIRDLVAAKVPVDARLPVPHQKTGLMLAMSAGHVDAVNALLDAGASLRLERASWDRSTPLDYATRAPNFNELIAVLKKHGLTQANDLAVNLTTSCARDGNVDCLRLLADEGLDLKATSAGREPLFAAAARSRSGTVRFLLEQGVKPVGEGHLVAAFSGVNYASNEVPAPAELLATARLLMAAGASVEETDRYGETPLHKLAHANGPWPELFELLRSAGANRCHRSVAGQDVAAAAIERNAEYLYWIEQPGWSCKTLAESIQGRPARWLTAERRNALGATAYEKAQPAMIVADHLELRATPSPSAEKLAPVDAGARGVVLARVTAAAQDGGLSGHWLLWDDGGRRGWVLSPYVAFIDGDPYAALVTGRWAEDERQTIRVGVDRGERRCEVRSGDRAFAPDRAFGRWDPEETPSATLLVFTRLNADATLDPVCVSRTRDTVQLCPLLSTAAGSRAFTPAPCVKLPGTALPTITPKLLEGTAAVQDDHNAVERP